MPISLRSAGPYSPADDASALIEVVRYSPGHQERAAPPWQIQSRPVALITGASSGIGVELAREAAKDGHDLILVARRLEPMQALAAELKAAGAEIAVISADLGKPGGAAALMETVEARGLATRYADQQCRPWRYRPFRSGGPGTNFLDAAGQHRGADRTHPARPPEDGGEGTGKIMLVASTAAFQPGPGMAVYYASKVLCAELRPGDRI